ncbi:MAG TPA: hypothetical protein VFA43_08515 [Gemmatimonadaceae bacterium]|jgi:hypothetical protein|nr:hypothetical protein [Gemmatimonadaceae bacterium]
MRTIFSRTVFAGLALVALATGAAAQDRTRLLTSIEVKELVARAQPDDHARLRDHFGALADSYAVDAKLHKAMAQVLTGNPNHPPAVSPGARHLRLAEAANQSAATLRELSNHHGRLAGGLTSQPPANSARFENGEGAPAPTAAQLRELSAGARTAVEHRALESYFSDLAAKYTSDARRHDAMARGYRGHANDRSGSFAALAVHCEGLAKSSRESASAALAAAAEHRQPPTVG